MKEWITAPWPWYVAGPMITLVMVFMLFSGKSFGISSTLRTLCSMSGGGKWSSYFQLDRKDQLWNLVFILGAIIGGYIASVFMTSEQSVALGPETLADLQSKGISQPGSTFFPELIFSWSNLLTAQGLTFMVLGGFLVGFGTRYAEGCTSGHAITGLSNLQWPSLVAVVGFFIGGLLVTYLVLPYLL